MYDASDRQSFLKLKKMYMTVKEIETSARRGKSNQFKLLYYIVGNKSDLKLSKHLLNEQDK